MESTKVAVIGAGLGGLSTGCLLAKKGYQVTIYEKNSTPGGKIAEVRSNGFRFDTGPSLLTMPEVLHSLFERCNASLDDYLSLSPLHTICRYFYPDGTTFNCYHDIEDTLKEVRQIAPEDAKSFKEFLQYSATLYEYATDAFLLNPLHNFRDIQSLNITDVFKIDALQTVSQRVDSFFVSEYMRRFFKRFTTYNGSSPYQAPATLNIIPHVELGMGGFYIKGGIYRLVEALMKLGRDLGISFQFDTEIRNIITENKRVQGIESNTETIDADLVISNSDAHETYLNLLSSGELPYLKKKKLEQVEPSCSGFVLLLGLNRSYKQLSHHNIFFSNDYRKEFGDIFDHKIMPDDPTIYISNTSHQDPGHAPDSGSNLFILINAPYLSDNWNWEEKKSTYADVIIKQLEERGLSDLGDAIQYQETITPKDFYNRYRSNRGSIYGTSSNSKMAAFLRPANKAREIKGLYLTGGSTHPGGGIPLVILSAFNVLELIGRYE